MSPDEERARANAAVQVKGFVAKTPAADPFATLIRELAILERKGFTLTTEERRALDSYRSPSLPVELARRKHLRLIQGGQT